MKINHFLILIFSFFTVILSCGKDEVEEAPTITVETPEPETPSDSGTDTSSDFVEGIDPDLNEGTITFEEYGPSFSLENAQAADRLEGNWGYFGGANDQNLTVAYAENQEQTA
jgi:hypothetical protein